MPELYLDPPISLDNTRLKIDGKCGLKTPIAVGQ
jgi:hypothetical protein